MTSVQRPARILVVCTGNICRSPLAERLLRARLAAAGVDESQVVVTSAGTHAMVRHPMTDEAAQELATVGGEPRGHLARQLTAALVSDADLVVTATLAHRSQVVTLHPKALRYAFGLLELARLVHDVEPAQGSPADRVRGLGALAVRRRGLVALAEAGADDVPDPYGQPRHVYAATTARIVPAVDLLARAISAPGRAEGR